LLEQDKECSNDTCIRLWTGDVLEKCFAGELAESGWLPKLKEIIATYGIDLAQDADACRKTRADTAAILKVENI
jgi:malate dehydrogenase (quinone)